MYDIPGAVDAMTIDPIKGMKVIVVGEKGAGKSLLAATTQSLFDFDFDGRANALAGKPGVMVKTYIDINPAAKAEAWLNAEKDLQQFEYLKNSSKPIPEFFCFDSLQQGSKAALDYVLMMNEGMRRVVTVGAKTVYAPKNWDAYNLEYPLVRDFLSRLMALGNVLVNCHESPEEAPDSTVEKPNYTGRVTIYPVRMKKLLPLFNDVWRVVIKNGERKVITNSSDYRFAGSTSLLIDGEEAPDIKKMIAKHRANQINKTK